MPQTQRALQRHDSGSGSLAKRREPRVSLVRRVEYTRFPRLEGEGGERVGFTRNVSRSGMCISAEAPEPTGSLLRLVMHDVGGSAQRPGVGRVIWCLRARSGRYWVGVQVLAGSAQQ